MFHMMNEARVGVGAGAAALGYTGYLKSSSRTPTVGETAGVLARIRAHRRELRPPGRDHRRHPEVR
jgi:L-aminopeptidase/D-esterase-like protein